MAVAATPATSGAAVLFVSASASCAVSVDAEPKPPRTPELSVLLPGTELATIRGVRPQPEMTDSDLDVAGVRYERLAPMRRWRIVADAEARVRDLSGTCEARRTRLRLDCTFDALIPAIGLSGTTLVGVTAGGLAVAGALLVTRMASRVETAHPEPFAGVSAAIEVKTRAERGRRRTGSVSGHRSTPAVLSRRRLAAVAVGLSGFAGLLYEIAWLRVDGAGR